MRKRTICLALCTLVGLFFFVQAVSHEVPYEYRGFTATNVYTFKEANCKLVELEHAQSGATIIHVQNDDPENMFALCFRTPVADSKGAPHIIEHSVLQGSKKYPVKGAFYHMLKRTFATLINAYTGPDHTVYPSSTLVPEDFYNLLSAYTDAVFHPLLNKSTFLQEGHRLEFQTFDDPTSPLIYNGVVYNEMKGYFSNPRLHLIWGLWAELFPESRGVAISGGDPQVIPELTYDEFVQFHQDHYYPGNCLFFFYGDLPLEKHLDFLAENVLTSDVVKRPAVPKRKTEPRFNAPTYKEVSFPASSDETLMGLAWLLPEDTDAISFRILNHILMASDASLLKDEILSSGLCKQVSVSIDTHSAPFAYYYIFEGCTKEQAKALEELVLTRLKQIMDAGISENLIEQAIQRFELEEREIKQERGSSYIDSVVLAKLNGLKPEDAFLLTEQLAKVRASANMSECIKKALVDNPHRVCLVMTPSEALSQAHATRDREKLDAIRASLSDDDVEAIIMQAKEFRKGHDDIPREEINCLPTVTLEHVSKEVPEYPVEVVSDVIHYDTFTNHITYMLLEYPLPHVAVEDLWLVGLYSYLLPQLGTNERDYKANLEYIDEKTGSLKANLSILHKKDSFVPVLQLTSKALDRNANTMLEIICNMAMHADFSDKDRIKQLIIKHTSELDHSLKMMALEYAKVASLSSQSYENFLIHKWEGLDYYEAIMSLSKNLDGSLDGLILKLQNLQKILVPNDQAKLVVACDKNARNSISTNSIKKIPYTESMRHNVLRDAVSFGYSIPSAVAYNVRGVSCVRHNPYLLLAAELLTSKVLMPRVRLQNGAYSSFARYDSSSGDFTLCSYRDPNIALTDAVFSDAIELLVKGEFTEDDVQNAKIALIRKLDLPLHVSTKAVAGYQLLMEERTTEERKDLRSKILSATSSDIQQAVATHIVPQFQKSTLVSIASKELIETKSAL